MAYQKLIQGTIEEEVQDSTKPAVRTSIEDTFDYYGFHDIPLETEELHQTDGFKEVAHNEMSAADAAAYSHNDEFEYPGPEEMSAAEAAAYYHEDEEFEVASDQDHDEEHEVNNEHFDDYSQYDNQESNESDDIVQIALVNSSAECHSSVGQRRRFIERRNR